MDARELLMIPFSGNAVIVSNPGVTGLRSEL
jgi:hypothetical protein